MTEFNEETVAETVPPVDNAEASESIDSDAAAAVEDRVNELTADIQRLQAEYANSRKRVERDRAVAREAAIGDVQIRTVAHAGKGGAKLRKICFRAICRCHSRQCSVNRG